MKIILSLHLNPICKELFDSFAFSATVMANHLGYLISLEQLSQNLFVGSFLQGFLKLIEEKVQEFGCILLNTRVDGGNERAEQFFGRVVNPLGKEEV